MKKTMKNYGKRIGALALSFSMILGSLTGGAFMSTKETKAADVNGEIVINGDDVEAAAENVNGLPYKGFGVLSGNSTSDLLLDYKYQNPYAYNQLLQVLFGGEHPLMNHVKMEMGNDGNNSTGADSCTKRYENEKADASRSPGFVLAADAKKVNPNVKVSILRWEIPNWVKTYWNGSEKKTKGYEAIYSWYKETVIDCYERWGYILDYINPDKNETWSPDNDFIKWFRNRMSNDDDFPLSIPDEVIEQYQNTKIIASDENTGLSIVPNMRKDAELYKAVDAIGFHYTTGTQDATADYRKMADVDDKEVWYSEGCASFSYTKYQENKTVAYGAKSMGGYQSPIAMCDCMVKSAVYSRKSHYIFQPAIGSFYEGAQYDHKELLSAREPWAGTVHYDEAIYCLAHFFKFAKTGWENEDNTAGIWRIIPQSCKNNSDGTEHLRNEAGNPSFMTLASPDKKDFSTVVVNNSNKTVAYELYLENMDIPEDKSLEIWETVKDSYLQHVEDITPDGDGVYRFELSPYSVITVTSLECAGKEEYEKRLPAEAVGTVLDTNEDGSAQDTSNDILYADDFKYESYDKDYLYSRGFEPRYTVDYSGAFFVEDGRLKQDLSAGVDQWQNNEPNAVIGDFRWMNYTASVDVEIPDNGYVGIVAREQTGMGYTGSGYSLQITKNGNWTFKKRDTTIGSGTVSAGGKYNLALECNGSTITALIDGNSVKEYNDSSAEYFGRIRLISGWNKAYYDNLLVKKIDGALAYGKAIIDNADDGVRYSGNWDIQTNGSSNDWYRSTSKSSSSGASFTFNIDADGFALIGENGSNVKLDIECDGKTIESGIATQSSRQHCAPIMIDGLGEGEHEIKVTLKSGSLTLDAIMPYGGSEVVNVQSVNIDDSAKVVVVGEAIEDKTATALPEEATNKTIHYYTFDNDIVKVDSVTGAVKALAVGEATVYAAATDGSRIVKSYKVSVVGSKGNDVPTVTNAPATNAPANDGNITATEPKAPKAPVLKSVKKAKGKVKITWKKVSGAAGYVVERSIGNKKKFKAIKTISKAKTVTYTDKKAKKGKKNFYRVRAYVKNSSGKKILSKVSKVRSVKM